VRRRSTVELVLLAHECVGPNVRNEAGCRALACRDGRHFRANSARLGNRRVCAQPIEGGTERAVETASRLQTDLDPIRKGIPMKAHLTTLVCCCITAITAVAHAEPRMNPSPEDASEVIDTSSDIHEHDGFYLSMRLGPGYSKLRSSGLTASGQAVDFGLSIGGAITDNLVLFGETNMLRTKDPTVTLHGTEAKLEDSAISVFGYGVGVAYYFMPLNAYVAASAVLSHGELETPVSAAESETGYGGLLRAGWEAWVSQDWGLGVCAQFQMSSMKDSIDDVNWSSKAASIALSATYN